MLSCIEVGRRLKNGSGVTRSLCFADRSFDEGTLAPADLVAIDNDVMGEVQDAVAFAEAGTLESVEDLTRYVHSEVDSVT